MKIITMRPLDAIWMILLIFFANEGYAQSLNDSIIGKNLDIFSAVYRKVLDRYPNSIDADSFMLAALTPMLETIDPYTHFYTEEQAFELEQWLNPKFGGVGVMLRDSPDGVMVTKVISNTPAEKAGVTSADQITAIDGASISQMPFDDVFGLLRGRPGSEVTLSIKKTTI